MIAMSVAESPPSGIGGGGGGGWGGGEPIISIIKRVLNHSQMQRHVIIKDYLTVTVFWLLPEVST